MSSFEINPRKEFDDESSAQQLDLLAPSTSSPYMNSKLNLDFIEESPALKQDRENERFLLASSQSAADQNNPKYFGYSALLHGLFALLSLLVQLPAFEKPQVETITVELEEPSPEIIQQVKASLGKNEVLPTRGSPAAAKELSVANATQKVQAPLNSDLSADRIEIPAKKSPHSKSLVGRAKTHTGGGKASVATHAPSQAGVPDSLEDIAAPKLDAEGVEFSQVGKLGDNEFDDDFKKVDHATKASVKAFKNSMDQELKQVADEKDEELKSAEEENRKFAHQVDEAKKARRLKDSKAIAEAQSAEQAAVERAARDAALAENLKRQQEQAARAKGNGQGTKLAGAGAGNNGQDQKSDALSGSPTGVRSLEQLRQMPGNPRPAYSTEERLRRNQGEIVFHAYVSKEGSLSKFKLLRSTNFRNLDAKTLAALKKWRFYPGQEGWVELPFRWDLKGGIQEMPTLLRRR